jgi:hypothetical protein
MLCPVCRADNADGPHCRRCRADLSLLFDLEEQRTDLLHQCAEQANLGNWPEVFHRAEQAHGLRHGDDSLSWQALARLMQRDFAGAWHCYQSARQKMGP